MKVKFKFLADQVLLSEYDRYVAIPEDKEVLPFALVERLAHLLDAILLILDESLLELTATRLAHLILQQVS